MAEAAVISPSIPQGSLRSAFAKLDEDLLAASTPGSPAMSPTNITSQSDITPSPLASKQPTSAPSSEIISGSSRATKNPQETVLALLTNPNPSASVIAPLTTEDATLLCPHWNMPESEKRSRRHSSVAHTGAEAIAKTLKDMRQHRRELKFDVEKAFSSGGEGEGEDVAVFGRARYESDELARRVQVPFAVWAKLSREGRVEFMELIGE